MPECNASENRAASENTLDETLLNGEPIISSAIIEQSESKQTDACSRDRNEISRLSASALKIVSRIEAPGLKIPALNSVLSRELSRDLAEQPLSLETNVC